LALCWEIRAGVKRCRPRRVGLIVLLKGLSPPAKTHFTLDLALDRKCRSGAVASLAVIANSEEIRTSARAAERHIIIANRGNLKVLER
jgi:hypothetical protein